MEKLRVGVIGVGYLGKFHARKYAAMEDVELVGVVDVNPEVAGQVAAANRTRAYSDYNDLLEKVEAVSIVVPTTHHHQVASVCLEKGIDVLIEKPMTSSLEQADDLIALAEKNNLILQAGLLEQYNPAVLAMEEHITKPLFLESHRIHVFKDRGTDVDVVLDLMIHDLDIVLSLVDSPIQMIHAVGMPVVTRKTDIANARLVFENGCTANITVSRISRDNIRRLRVFQPNSYIAVDYGNKELTVVTQSGELNEEGVPRENVLTSCFMEKDALELELRDFVKNVKNRTAPRVSGNEGRRALGIALEIISQIKQHASRYGNLLKG